MEREGEGEGEGEHVGIHSSLYGNPFSSLPVAVQPLLYQSQLIVLARNPCPFCTAQSVPLPPGSAIRDVSTGLGVAHA
eukprot:81220-Rhodomonas_salina.1